MNDEIRVALHRLEMAQKEIAEAIKLVKENSGDQIPTEDS